MSETDAAASRLIDSRLFNIRLRPLSLAFGVLGGELDVGVLPGLAFGVSGDWYGQGTGSTGRSFDAYEYGAVASIYLSGERFHGGWVCQPGVRYVLSDTGGDKSNRQATETHNVFFTATLGHDWFWHSGFNVNLGAGFSTAPWDSSRLLEPLAVWQVGFAI